ncbi:N-acetylglucosamine-6-phosphate deacetylase [Helcococcus kunzii]|uniref:N-acetylglucosamine-6-phosphate deacetylase n=1 Tax=Helcococcus kunzii ATCC 51366 TaxID=883114 RepID=H3NNN6_9FIRM|nr:N-acetylglucosamine-6-phosphate deacetylase [Helcococcus kunzii]EHR34011.1 N-acetylglucosamine-6-phosphate deacetylase [Helcococcus kunzii ATCC 51366]MCT1795619.1 N-acetylglucosamine-6-phosphate deacetylase [Helcococcus kunzii]MCT1988815.1 N-acetylglucosamine-6-phosphate deacetylase [Helcococcus kunzii]QUY64861.1 N-acetylglucosamine-6-phosphate deacetylase [Helcococcus kunzii]QZO77303.1 N-acetylglucosamine-6-phosphate deacetylase [Helcococcus kunzii]
MKKVFKASKIFLENEILENAFMVVEDKKITDFLTEYDGEYEDFGDKIIAPGLVDTHVHGYKNADVTDAIEGELNTMSVGMLEMGVTSFLPTTLTSSVEQLNKAVELIGKEYKDAKGAKIKGIFMEGPYFTEEFKGAQNPAYMSDPSIEQLKIWQDLSGGIIKKIAIAPERNGVEEFIKAAKEMGIYVALAHSNATSEEALNAVDAGANIFIHLYNGMRGLHHREPGMVGAALASDAFAELICDGHHVHPTAAKIAVKTKGHDKVLLITDCMRAGGMGEGESHLGEFKVIVKDGTARLESGSLAGSILDLIDGVKNVKNWNIADLKQAVDMATKVPAKSVGLEDECGILAVGRDADFIVIDKDVNLYNTYVNGEKLFTK